MQICTYSWFIKYLQAVRDRVTYSTHRQAKTHFRPKQDIHYRVPIKTMSAYSPSTAGLRPCSLHCMRGMPVQQSCDAYISTAVPYIKVLHY